MSCHTEEIEVCEKTKITDIIKEMNDRAFILGFFHGANSVELLVESNVRYSISKDSIKDVEILSDIEKIVVINHAEIKGRYYYREYASINKTTTFILVEDDYIVDFVEETGSKKTFLGIWEYNIDTNEVFINENMREKYGFLQSSITMENIFSSLTSESVSLINEYIAKINDVKDTILFEICTLEGKWYGIIGRIFINENNRRVVTGEVVDITKSKIKLEKAIQNEKMESLYSLSGRIAHDFNNCLMSISGSVELLKKYQTTLEGFTYISNIESAVKSSKELIKKLVSFTKVEPLEKAKYNIVVLVKDIVKTLANQDIYLTCETESIVAMGSPTLIQNAISHLINNAMDESRRVDIVVNKTYLRTVPAYDVMKTSIEEGNYAKIDIIDYGKGIPENVRKRMFDPFFTTKSLANCQGLGLSTVLNTVGFHDGCLTMKTGDNGTTFSMYLKIEEEKPEIMVVDDDELVRMVVTEILQECDYKTIGLSNGKDALEYYRSNLDTIKLVIVDMIMPEMPGEELIRELVKIKKSVKILILSGYANIDLDEISNYKFLAKPIDANTLISNVSNELYSHKVDYDQDKVLGILGNNTNLLNLLTDYYYEFSNIDYFDLYQTNRKEYDEKIKGLRGVLLMLDIQEAIDFIDQKDFNVKSLTELSALLKKYIS